MYKTISLFVIGLVSCATNPAASAEVPEFKSVAPPQYEVSEAKRSFWQDRIKDILLTPQISEGDKVVLYDWGVASLDSWYPTPGTAQKAPPKGDLHHEFTYLNGRLVTVHRTAQGERKLVNRIWHDRANRGPVLSTHYSNGQESNYFLAAYNHEGLMSEVVWMNKDFVPMRISFYEHTGIYETTLITNYALSKEYGISHREYWDGKIVWVDFDNKWSRPGVGNMRATLNSLQKFGIKPHYPIPEKDAAADDAVKPPRGGA